MSERATALHISIDLTEAGADSDFEVSQALRQLADHIASRRFAGLTAGLTGDLRLEQDGGQYRQVGTWFVTQDIPAALPVIEPATV